MMNFPVGSKAYTRRVRPLDWKKGKQLTRSLATSSESNAPDLDRVSEKAEEVDVDLSSIAKTNHAE